jgi:hypothetical protein
MRLTNGDIFERRPALQTHEFEFRQTVAVVVGGVATILASFQRVGTNGDHFDFDFSFPCAGSLAISLIK